MAEYLKNDNLDIDTDILFETEIQDKNIKTGNLSSLCITIEQPPNAKYL